MVSEGDMNVFSIVSVATGGGAIVAETGVLTKATDNKMAIAFVIFLTFQHPFIIVNFLTLLWKAGRGLMSHRNHAPFRFSLDGFHLQAQYNILS